MYIPKRQILIRTSTVLFIVHGYNRIIILFTVYIWDYFQKN